MSGPIFLVLDAETTGREDPPKDQVIELGCAATDLDELLGRESMLVKPTVPVDPGASAVHHLIDEDLEHQLPLEEVLAAISKDWLLWSEAVAYVAHNAPFDKRHLGALTDKPWVDTLRMAKRYYPELPGHSNQFLRYYFRLLLDPQSRQMQSHRAEFDCVVTAALLRHMLNGPARDDFERMGVAEFAKFIDGPLLLSTVTFGKHAGKKWSEVPRDYLQWILRQPDFEPDTVHTARHWLSAPGQAPQI
jgi:exodeoxyribonuclease X